MVTKKSAHPLVELVKAAAVVVTMTATPTENPLVNAEEEVAVKQPEPSVVAKPTVKK
jgi:hypothetical protein